MLSCMAGSLQQSCTVSAQPQMETHLNLKYTHAYKAYSLAMTNSLTCIEDCPAKSRLAVAQGIRYRICTEL